MGIGETSFSALHKCGTAAPATKMKLQERARGAGRNGGLAGAAPASPRRAPAGPRAMTRKLRKPAKHGGHFVDITMDYAHGLGYEAIGTLAPGRRTFIQ